VQHADRLVLLDRGRVVLDSEPRAYCLRRDVLEAAGVRPPQIAELSHALLQAGVPLPSPPVTIEEAVAVLQRLLMERGADGRRAAVYEPAG
jgi:energy-coupling factor transport system ATP-binding protein